MPSAIVILNTIMVMEIDFFKRLRSYGCVEEPFAAQSVFDIVAKVKAEAFDNLREIMAAIKRPCQKRTASLPCWSGRLYRFRVIVHNAGVLLFYLFFSLFYEKIREIAHRTALLD